MSTMSIEAEQTAAKPVVSAGGSPKRARLGAWPVVALGIFISMTVVSLVGFELWRDRDEIEAQAFRETRNVTALLDSHVSQSIASAIEVLRAFAERSQIALESHTELSSEFATVVSLLPEGLPQIGGLILMDPSGRVLVSTVPTEPAQKDLSKTDYLQRITRGGPAQTESQIGSLRQDELGNWVIPISRGILNRDGKFAGAVALIVDPRPLVAVFGSLDVGEFSAVTLVQDDGVIVARSRDEGRFVGRTIAGGELERRIAASSPSGSIRAKGLLYGRDLFLSYRKIAGTPYVIDVAFDANQLLTPWYRVASLYGVLGIVLLAAILVSVWLVLKDQRRTAVLTASRQRQAIIDGMSAQIALLDTDGSIIEANRALLESAGLGPIDVVGRPLWETFWYSYSTESQRRVRSAIARAASGESARADFTVRVGQSVFATIDVAFQAIEDTTTGKRWIVASGLDVTKRRQLERQLAQSQKLEAIGLVAGGIAHDFNNLLGAISNFAHFLVEDLRDLKPQHSFAVRIADACEYGKQVVTQLLAYARPGPKMRSEIDLRAVLQQIETLTQASLPSSVTLSCEFPAAAVNLLADRSQLTQVFLNLALNARDAIEGGRGNITIRLARVSPSSPEHPAIPLEPKWKDAAVRRAGPADPTQTYGLVAIEDDGAGIEPESLHRIFEPFFSTKPRERGTGLGLAIVDSAILALGGTYIVESQKGKGTRFLVYLPVHEPELGRAFASAAPSDVQLVA